MRTERRLETTRRAGGERAHRTANAGSATRPNTHATELPAHRLLPLHVARHSNGHPPGLTALMGGAVTSPEIFSALGIAACGVGRALCPDNARPKIALIVSSKAGDEAARKAVFEDEYKNGKLVDTSIQHYFEGFGFEPVFIPLTIDNHETAARDPELVELIESCQAVYLCGGDQAKHVHCLLEEDGSDTPVMSAIRRVHERGGVVSGSSAGAAAQGSVQYGVGRSYTYLVENHLGVRDIAAGTLDDPKNDNLGSLGLGLGLVGRFNAIVCTHFDESYRLGRLMVAVKETARAVGTPPIGIGVDEDTALLVQGDVGRVHGKGGVFIVDAERAEYGDGPHFEAKNVRLHYLTAGDEYDFVKKEVISAKDGAHRPTQVIVSRDIFAPREATRVITSLLGSRAESTRGYSRQKDPQFVFTFTKDDETRVKQGAKADTVAGLRIDVACAD